jgi:multiple sugar transport system substrate-binding protein
VNNKQLTRRDFLRLGALTAAGAALAGCGGGATPEVIKEQVEVTRVVEKEGETVVETVVEEVEVVVTATPPPSEPVPVHYTMTGNAELTDEVLRPMIQEKLGDSIIFTADVTPWGSGGWDTYGDNLITRIAGGEGLDIIHIAIEGVPLLTAKKILRPLDPFFDADPEFQADVEEDIHPTLMDALKWDGNQMELPTDWNNMVIHYNYKIFEEKGVPEPGFEWSWDQFVEDSLTITDVTGSEEDLYAFSFWYSQFGISPWYHNNDTSPFTDDWMDSNMLDPKVAETLQFMADLVLKHKVSPSPEGWDEHGQFTSRHLAMRGCGGWCISAVNDAEFYDYKLQYYPHNQGPLRTVVGVGGDGIATMARHPDACWEVLKLVNSTEYQLEYIVWNGSPMSRRSVVETPIFTDRALPSPADMGIYYDSLDYAKFVPSPPNFNVIDPLLQRWYSQIWNGELTVEEAVVGAHEELQAEMDRMKQELGI